MVDFEAKHLYLLDMDGTLYLGDRLFPATRAFLRRIREKGGRYLFTTNNSSRGVDAYVDRLRRLGLDAEAGDFLTSTDVLIRSLRGRYDDALIYPVGTATFRDQLARAGFRLTDRPEDGVTLLVCGFDTELTFQKLEDASYLLTRGVDFIATNPDWVCPTAWGYVPDCGSVCQMLTRATGKTPTFVGKPQPEMALQAMERWGATPRETVMIGDRLYTDVACALNAGIDAAFVLSGEGTEADIQRYQITPTGIYRDIGEILERMG